MIPLLRAGYLAEVDGIPYWFSDVRQENYEAIKKGNASVLRLSRARMAREREREILRWKGWVASVGTTVLGTILSYFSGGKK